MDQNIIHVLPPQSNGDTSWFYRQNRFEQQEILRQVKFKNRHWPDIENGAFSKQPNHLYPHILPNDLGVFYHTFSSEVYEYFDEADIAIHSEVLNLKSSQAACVNILFPFRQNLEMARAVFQPFLKDVVEVTKIEFEDTGEISTKPGDITSWLGEPPGGKRGQNRTSIDCAIYWRDKASNSNVTLIEWKYTERGFGSCGAYNSKNANAKTRAKCNEVLSIGEEQACLLVGNGPNRSRHYWDLLQDAGILIERLGGLGACPFSGPLYQVMRQFLIASYLRQNGFDLVDVIVIGFSGNESLKKVPRVLSTLKRNEGDSIIDIWNNLINEVPPLRHIEVEELFKSIDMLPALDVGWRNYINERYGV